MDTNGLMTEKSSFGKKRFECRDFPAKSEINTKVINLKEENGL